LCGPTATTRADGPRATSDCARAGYLHSQREGSECSTSATAPPEGPLPLPWANEPARRQGVSQAPVVGRATQEREALLIAGARPVDVPVPHSYAVPRSRKLVPAPAAWPTARKAATLASSEVRAWVRPSGRNGGERDRGRETEPAAPLANGRAPRRGHETLETTLTCPPPCAIVPIRVDRSTVRGSGGLSGGIGEARASDGEKGGCLSGRLTRR
jgi:hypothetical protein